MCSVCMTEHPDNSIVHNTYTGILYKQAYVKQEDVRV